MKPNLLTSAVQAVVPMKQKGLRWLVRALLGLFALWVLAWLAVPPLLVWQLESRLGALLGRQVSVGRVDFAPWSLELSVHDLAMAGAAAQATANAVATDPPQPGAAPQFTLKRFYMDLELQSLLRLAPVVDALHLEAPHLRLTHTGQGHYDLDDVLARLAGDPEAPADPGADPLRFALYNLVLSDAEVTFNDAPKAQVHRLNQLQLSVPFLSNLASKRDVRVQPRLAFDLNGSSFDSSADTTPFAQTRKTAAQLKISRLDLAPYLGYWPAGLPVRLSTAVLDADLQLAFEQAEATTVSLSGWVQASGVQLNVAAGGAELLAFERLSLQLQDVQPLTRRVKLGQVSWKQPRLTLRRSPAGVLELLALNAEPGRAGKTRSGAGAANATAVQPVPDASAAALQPPQPAAWQVAVEALALEGGDILWLDQAAARPVQLSLSGLALQARAVAWPMVQPVPFEGQARLADATLQFKGQASDTAAEVSAQLAKLPLSLAQPYLAAVLLPRLDGVLQADLALNWQAATPAHAASTVVQVRQLSLDQLALQGKAKAPLASVGQVWLSDVALDLSRQSATLGSVKITQPRARVARSADGRWMFEDWLQTSTPAPTAAPTASSQRPAASTAPGWALAVADLQVLQGAFTLADDLPAQPVALAVSGLGLQLKNVSTQGSRPFGLNLSARLSHGNTEPGQLAWRGSSQLSPLALKGDLQAERLPLHALAPYLGDTLNVALLRADASFSGRLDLAQKPTGWAFKLNGDARLEDLQTHTLAQAEPFVPAEQLLNWKSLSLSGVSVALAPDTAAQVAVQGTVLSDFYARLILSEAGRLNLQDVLKPAAPSSAALASPAGAPGVTVATAYPPSAAPAAPVAAPENVTVTAPAPTAVAALAPVIRFGPVSLVGGHIQFTDRFIRPNYSADLTELVGRLSAFASQAATGELQLADLELRGRAEGSATLEVLGKINPLVQPVALDIQGRVRDLELAPLSTYSARYAGYGIERGKLSVDVSYRIQPDGLLTANNKLVLNQLQFGDAVPGATNSLPVKLAVALLADRHGVIDIDLPVSGSLNDPQFRLMPIVFKIIGNLIVKAITAPFSLLANAFGGGADELSLVRFDAGSAVLSAPAKAALDKVAQALQDRPALKMTVVGTASLQAEREAFKRQQLLALVLAEQRRTQPPSPAAEGATVAAGAPPAAPVPTEPAVSEAQYPALLKAVYKRGDFPKPRNLIGLTKDIPVADMEALLLTHLDASEAALQALAVKRGVAVRDYLASRQLPAERLFLGAAKAVQPDAGWQPHAELKLAVE